MEQALLIVHVIAALALVGLVLIQQGKGAEMGASFGSGASQTVFGSEGSIGFIGRTTGMFATVFFITSFGLAYVASDKASKQEGFQFQAPPVPEVVEEARPAPESDMPQIDGGEALAPAGSDVPLLEQVKEAATAKAAELQNEAEAAKAPELSVGDALKNLEQQVEEKKSSVIPAVD